MTRLSRASLWLMPLGFVLLGPSPVPAQFLPDGTYTYAPWTSGSTNGDNMRGIAIQSDSTGQKILAAGMAANNGGFGSVGIARYWSDESFDTSYGIHGVSVVGPPKAYGNAIALPGNGKAIVVGSNI